MLAQQRKKQRLAADPQNQSWRQDSTSVGHRLLAKMGWSEGKGLGKDEAGSTEYVRVKPNHELAGIGAGREHLLNDSYAQLSSFDALLKDAWKGEEVSMDNEHECGDKKRRRDKEHHGGEKKKERRDKKEKHRDTKKEHRDTKKEPRDKKREDGNEKPARPAHLAHRSKFIRNKQVGQYSEERLKEILLTK